MKKYMKIRKILIAVTVILIGIYVFAFYYINRSNLSMVDVTKINDVVKSIESEFESQQYAIAKTGNKNNISYKIVFLNDDNYNATVFNAMENRYTVADLCYAQNADTESRLVGKIMILSDHSEETLMKSNLLKLITLVTLIVLALIYAVAGYVYYRILRPFVVMQQFAGKVAEGDLDFNLSIDRDNYFGAFTESFDLMREELRRARQGEYEANISKKELVAELSHDIKTPVATIKAICELLQAKMQNATGDNENAVQKNAPYIEKIEVIYDKADVIDKLISNMFHVTLEELEVLKVNVSEQPSTIILQMFSGINSAGKISLKNNITECLIKCDPLRMEQVIDNIISNSYKYAGTDIYVEFCIDNPGKVLGIKIKDFGSGISADELPLVFEKFYRGSDLKVKNSSGSGLGLYLAKQFMEGMGGTIECYNDNGFVVELHVRIA